MKIAFLGKGGSGKSTMATATVRHFHDQGFTVLAIDADHNMDLSYNLGADPGASGSSIFLGSDPGLVKESVGSVRDGTFKDALQKGREMGFAFRLDPADAYTAAMSVELRPRLRLMTAGPHTESVRSQESCSHSLAAPLKVYLPLLTITSRQVVVVDERAGTDPVATGILAGVDLAVIVREPTVHSRRVAEQIRAELALADIPHVIVDNKVKGIEEDARTALQSVSRFLAQKA